MSRKKIGAPVGIRVPLDVQAMLVAAAKLATAEGKPVDDREMLNRVLLPGAVCLLSCSGCRSGKCPTHRIGGVGSGSSPMAPIPNGAIRLESKDAPCYPNAPTPSDKPIETAANVPSAPVQVEALTSQLAFVGATIEDIKVPADVAAFVESRTKKPERKTRAAKIITEDSPEFARLIDVYHVEFVRVRKEKPAYTSRDFAAFRALLKSQKFERACELIRNAFAHEFWANRVTIRKIADNPSEFVGDVAASLRRSSGQVEPDENFFADQERRWPQENAS